MELVTNIEAWPVEKLKPYENNSRVHTDEQIEQIKASIVEFGFNNPILVDSKNGVVAGHGRLLAAKALGAKKVPVIVLDHLTDAQKRAYVIADNKIGDNSHFDLDMLKIELIDLQAEDFDLSLLGFSDEELDELLAGIDLDEDEKDGKGEEEEPTLPEIPHSKRGDIWLCGQHRIMCGDSTDMNDVQTLIAGQVVDMVYTDPPYGINAVMSNGKVASSKMAKSNIYAPIAGDDSIEVAIKVIEVIKTLDAKVQIIWGGNYYAQHLPNSMCWIVWDKDNGASYFADAELAWTNQESAVRIFKHTWNGMIKGSEHGQKRVHPTQKPIALAEWCLENYGEDCGTVLDLFGGSGSTLLACENKGKKGLIMELSPNYVDVICQRLYEQSGVVPVHAATRKKFPVKKNDTLPN